MISYNNLITEYLYDRIVFTSKYLLEYLEVIPLNVLSNYLIQFEYAFFFDNPFTTVKLIVFKAKNK